MDWQLSRFASPVLDLFYNLLGFSTKSFRDNSYQNLMQHYHNALSDNVRKLGSDPEKLFTYADLESELKKCGKYAFVWGIRRVQISLADSKDFPDMDQYCENMGSDDNDVELIAKFDGERQIEYEQRVRDLVQDLIDYGYYWK